MSNEEKNELNDQELNKEALEQADGKLSTEDIEPAAGGYLKSYNPDIKKAKSAEYEMNKRIR